MSEPMTDADLLAALEAAEHPFAHGERYAMPSTDGETAVRNAIAALSPTARELMAWVARHHGAVLWLDRFGEWAGIGPEEAGEAYADLVSRVYVHRLGKRRGRETWEAGHLAVSTTQLRDPETDALSGAIVQLGSWALEHPALAAAWRVQPFDNRHVRDIWRRAWGEETLDR